MRDFDGRDPVDLRLLQTFEAIVRTGSATAAAGALGRTQSAISHRIRELERDLGLRLFERSGQRMVLTPHGERLHELSVDLVAQGQDLRRRLLDDAAPDGNVQLGAPTALAAHLVAPCLATVLRDYPRVRVDLVGAQVDELVVRVRGAALDFAIMPGHVSAPDLVVEQLGTIEMVLVLPPDAPIGQGARVDLDTIRNLGLRYIAYGSPTNPTFSSLDRFALEHGLIDDRTPRIPHIATLRGTIAAGGGFTFLPGYVTDEDVRGGRARTVDLIELEQSQPLTLVKRRSLVPTPALEVVLDALYAIEL